VRAGDRVDALGRQAVDLDELAGAFGDHVQNLVAEPLE
jgi:hypothetical protein